MKGRAQQIVQNVHEPFCFEKTLGQAWHKTLVLRQPIDVCHVRLIHLKKQNDFKKKKKKKSSCLQPLLPSHRSPLLPSCRTSTTATQIVRVERFQRRKSYRCALCFLLWGCVILACPNLHHTTHRITPPHRSPKLCMELVNISEPS